uniref:hypothetical protein n=1 Tax=Solidesulfovibrio alcoholivorans TaxID=81406 RepID=UPI001B808743
LTEFSQVMPSNQGLTVSKTVGFVGASLARGKFGFGTGRLRGFYTGEEKKGRWEGCETVNS